jgi:hypothetical protein
MIARMKRGHRARASAAGLACLVAGFAGCDEGGPGYQNPPDAGTNLITVRLVDTYHSAAGDEDVAERTLPQAQGPRAWVQQGDAPPRYVEYGVDQGEGIYQLHFPEGRAYAGCRDNVVVDAEGTIDFGSSYVGRADAEYAASGTVLRLSGDGLAPWRATDDVLVVAPNASGFGFAFSGAGLPALDGTVITALDLDWTYEGLVDATRGDELWALQESYDVLDDVHSFWHLPRVLHLTDVVQSNGGVTQVQGSFVTPPLEDLSVDVRFARFAAALPAGADDAFVEGRLRVVSRRFGREGATDVFDEIASLYSYPVEDGVVSMSYENPYPAEWPEDVEVSALGGRRFLLAGTTMPLLAEARVRVVLPRADAASGPLVPLVGPPLHLRVDGRDASADLTGISDGAEISWDAPSLGAPAGYVVELMRLDPYEGYTFDWRVVRFFSVSRSFRIVPGILQAGKTYYLRVTALAGADLDLVHAPLVLRGRYGAADALSATLTL